MPHRLLSLIAPPLCGICGDPCAPTDPICTPCNRALAKTAPLSLTIPHTDSALAAAPYTNTARALITALKFSRRLALADTAAEAIAAKAGGHLTGTLVPVPPDPWRVRLRGFDAATLIAQNLARRTELPLVHCLTRRHAPRQVGRARPARLAAQHMVRANGPAPPRPILLDDVTTTGATLSACALALRHAGALEVLAVAFAAA